MEIVKETNALLSNFEVLQFLKQQKAEISKGGKKKKKSKDRLFTLTLEVCKYLGKLTYIGVKRNVCNAAYFFRKTLELWIKIQDVFA
jgi:hypothetical protein